MLVDKEAVILLADNNRSREYFLTYQTARKRNRYFYADFFLS